MAVIDLASVEQVKGYLGINSNADDPVLERLVTSASGYIQHWLNRDLGQEAYTDTVNGNDSDTMLFRNWPVTAVTAVSINGQAIPASTSSFAPGYINDSQAVYLRGHRFTRGRLNVVITYTAGYTDANLPAEITQACIEMIALRYREKDRIGLSSKGLAGEQINFSGKDMADSTRHILEQHRKVWPG